VRAVPDLKKKIIDWVPVNICASAITDILLRDIQDGQNNDSGYRVFNITNPHTTSWTNIIQMLQSSTRHKLEVVSMETWVKRLNTLLEKGADVESVPGLRLLSVFEDMAKDEKDIEIRSRDSEKTFVTTKTAQMSESFRSLQSYNACWMSMSLKAWGVDGFIA
jgi:hypothetical protein